MATVQSPNSQTPNISHVQSRYSNSSPEPKGSTCIPNLVKLLNNKSSTQTSDPVYHKSTLSITSKLARALPLLFWLSTKANQLSQYSFHKRPFSAPENPPSQKKANN